MTHAHLRPCPACARHVRVSEAGCPFCGATFAESFRASPRPQPPAARLTRAALFALGTGTLALAPGCSSSSSAAPPVVAEPAYGGPPQEGDASSGGGVVTPDGGLGDAAYGGPPPLGDGSSGGGADAESVDASSDAGLDGPVAEPAYGGPPQDASEDHVSIAPLYGIVAH
jgi:hypothetical protein